MDEMLGRSRIEEISLGSIPEDFDGIRLNVLLLERKPITSSITTSVQKEGGLRNEIKKENKNEKSKNVTQK